MNTNAKAAVFQTHISWSAHIQAEKFRRYQSQVSKARQVYLNTLAVCVANSYLNLLGWSTSLVQSDSWNPICQTMMDVADILIPGYGKLECPVVLSDQNTVIIPPETWSGRIGYLVVMLDQELQTATILGFISQVHQMELPLEQLKSLSQFPTYLSQQKRLEPTSNTDLSAWMMGASNSGTLNSNWQQLDRLFTSPRVMNFRNGKELAPLPVKSTSSRSASGSSSTSASRFKLVSFGQDAEHTITLILDIQPLNEKEFNVSVKVSNYQAEHYLPEGLELVIVDQASHSVMTAQANQTETIEFCFSGELKENFAVEIALEEQFVVEHFTI
jgi:flagellar biosynthesis/type III secretory pathway chaperone